MRKEIYKAYCKKIERNPLFLIARHCVWVKRKIQEKLQKTRV